VVPVFVVVPVLAVPVFVVVPVLAVPVFVVPPVFVLAWELLCPPCPLAYAEFASVNVDATTRAAKRLEKRFMGCLRCQTAVEVLGNRFRVASP
jgi:hypothetical protein